MFALFPRPRQVGLVIPGWRRRGSRALCLGSSSLLALPNCRPCGFLLLCYSYVASLVDGLSELRGWTSAESGKVAVGSLTGFKLLFFPLRFPAETCLFTPPFRSWSKWTGVCSYGASQVLRSAFDSTADLIFRTGL